VTTGLVELPGGRIRATLWFRLLQTIFQEIEDADIHEIERWKWQQMVWQAAGYYSPSLFGEPFRFDRTCAMLIATAIDQVEKGFISPKGREGHLFIRSSSQAAVHFDGC
jgi:hypothetical protein